MEARLRTLLTVIVILGVGAVGPAWTGKSGPKRTGARVETGGPWDHFVRPADGDLRRMLEPLQYTVTREDGTERAFQNAYWDNHDDGIYVDVVSGEPLFSSLDKFDSGTGWPSFTRPLAPEYVTEHIDERYGMRHTEVRSKVADSHLGHLFNDGPDPTGLRYCINSAAIRFVSVERMADTHYGNFLALFGRDGSEAAVNENTREVALLAGGCFWGMENILRGIPGVIETEVGYTGGRTSDADYEMVSGGRSGHAESIRVVFDPERLRFEELLGYFFRMHDPTTKNHQGNDVGSQYRSAIFYLDDGQRQTAERVKAAVDASGKWRDPVVTEIVPAGPFYAAEDYHQDYLVRNPNGYTCHYLRD